MPCLEGIKRKAWQEQQEYPFNTHWLLDISDASGSNFHIFSDKAIRSLEQPHSLQIFIKRGAAISIFMFPIDEATFFRRAESGHPDRDLGFKLSDLI